MEKQFPTEIEIGTFEVKTGKIRVSDPCYKLEAHDHVAQTLPAANGRWVGSVIYGPSSWGNRVHQLMAHLESSNLIGSEELLRDDVGVDSGQMSIIDLGSYPTGETGEYDDPTQFYGRVCPLTLDTPQSSGIFDGAGIVSGSGFGDGGYPVYVRRNAEGEVTSVRVVFIDDADSEDEEDDLDDGEEDSEELRVEADGSSAAEEGFDGGDEALPASPLPWAAMWRVEDPEGE